MHTRETRLISALGFRKPLWNQFGSKIDGSTLPSVTAGLSPLYSVHNSGVHSVLKYHERLLAIMFILFSLDSAKHVDH